MWRVKVLTLFPEMFPGPLGCSIVGNALDKAWELEAINLRPYGIKNRVDDSPAGGGSGMILRADVIERALAANHTDEQLIYLSPRGEPLKQNLISSLVEKPIMLLCGRYEGVDQRALDHYQFREISLGDFILSGGEIAAMALIDSCVRTLDGVLGDANSLLTESFSVELLEYPHYTRPQIWNDLNVPEVLLSGHHENISKWRLQKAEEITKIRRSDLWQRYIARKEEK